MVKQRITSGGQPMAVWTVRIPAELKEYLQSYAENHDMTVNSALTIALDRFRAQNDEETQP